MDTTDLVLRQQEYYDGRAEDWQRWITRYMRPVEGEVSKLLAELPLDGHVLDMACGTGYWTRQLADRATSVTALDGSAAMLEQVAQAGLPNVSVVHADLYSWNPPTEWDAVFFAHWLAHVPDDRFDRFWGTVDGALAPSGHVVIVDVAPEEQRIEEHIHERESVPLTRRRLRDGRQYDVVKKYWEPEELIERIQPLGFTGSGTKIGAGDGFGFVVWNVFRSSDDQS